MSCALNLCLEGQNVIGLHGWLLQSLATASAEKTNQERDQKFLQDEKKRSEEAAEFIVDQMSR